METEGRLTHVKFAACDSMRGRATPLISPHSRSSISLFSPLAPGGARPLRYAVAGPSLLALLACCAIAAPWKKIVIAPSMRGNFQAGIRSGTRKEGGEEKSGEGGIWSGGGALTHPRSLILSPFLLSSPPLPLFNTWSACNTLLVDPFFYKLSSEGLFVATVAVLKSQAGKTRTVCYFREKEKGKGKGKGKGYRAGCWDCWKKRRVVADHSHTLDPYDWNRHPRSTLRLHQNEPENRCWRQESRRANPILSHSLDR